MPGVAWAGVATMLAAVAVLNFWPPFEQIAYLALVVMGCAALGIFVPDLLWQKVQRRVLARQPAPGNWPRVAVKCLGLAGSLFFIALLYWLFPEYYQGHEFYGNYYAALKVLLRPGRCCRCPTSTGSTGAWRSRWTVCGSIGQLLLGRWRGLDRRLIGQHLLGWLVKGFFLPLMFTYFCDNLNKLLHYDLNLLTTSRASTTGPTSRCTSSTSAWCR